MPPEQSSGARKRSVGALTADAAETTGAASPMPGRSHSDTSITVTTEYEHDVAGAAAVVRAVLDRRARRRA